MGCGKICQAKKKAEKAKKEAANAKSNTPDIPGPPDVSGFPTPNTSSKKIMTVGHVLGVHEIKNTIGPGELWDLMGSASSNSQIMGTVAKDLIKPIKAAVGVYTGLKVGKMIMQVAKPVVKMAVNIMGVVFNFANIGELLQDIAMLLLSIFVGLAPMFIQLLTNIFFDIPVDTGALDSQQLEAMNILVQTSKINIKNSFSNAVNDLTAYNAINTHNQNQIKKNQPDNLIDYSDVSTLINNNPGTNIEDLMDIDILKERIQDDFQKGLDSSKSIIINQLNNDIKKQKINILEIPNVDSFSTEDKIKTKIVTEGLNDASKKIETLQANQLLNKCFSSNLNPNDQINDDDAIAIAAADLVIECINYKINNMPEGGSINTDDCFLKVFDKEIKKKKICSLKTRENIEALNFAEEIINQNKTQLVISIINNTKNINSDIKSDINLNPSFTNEIQSICTNMKAEIINNNTITINNYNANNTQDMIDLKNLILNDINTEINDYVVSVSQTSQDDLLNSIKNIISIFKNNIVSNIKEAINKSNINITELDIPNNSNKFEIKNMIDLLLKEVKIKLNEQTKNIIINNVLPCKACKPAEDIYENINGNVFDYIQFCKQYTIDNVNNQMNQLDLTINVPQDIDIKKSNMINTMEYAIYYNSPNINIIDDILFYLKAEEKELIKNVNLALETVAR